MARLNETPLLPKLASTDEMRQLHQALVPLLRATALKANQLAAGRFSALDETGTAAPTTGSWQQGDEIRNSNRTELGGGGSKYVLMGWVCVASGTPGTWREMRVLTGN